MANEANRTLRRIYAKSRRRAKTEAQSLPPEIALAIKARATEAVMSNEPHKITGGWVVSPFRGQAAILGMLEHATNMLRLAQHEAMHD